MTYENGLVTVEYSVMEGFFMSEAHVYLGCEKYPTKNGKPTVAPGQFTFNAGALDHINSLTATFDVGDYNGSFYLIAHAVTCEIVCTCPDNSGNNGTADLYFMNVPLDCVEYNVDPVQIDVFKNQSEINVYPNPFVNSFNVSYKFDYSTDVTVQVYDLLGILLYESSDNRYVKAKQSIKHINLPRTNSQTFVVKVITNREDLSRKVISKK